jgi:uncharacterized membrane protein YdfJ with MMPL/SSD domain
MVASLIITLRQASQVKRIRTRLHSKRLKSIVIEIATGCDDYEGHGAVGNILGSVVAIIEDAADGDIVAELHEQLQAHESLDDAHESALRRSRPSLPHLNPLPNQNPATSANSARF